MKGWKEAGKLETLRKSLGMRKLTRAQLYDEIRKVDPQFSVNLHRKRNRVTRMALLASGKQTLERARFTTIGNARGRMVIDAIGNALSILGTPGTVHATKQT